MSERQEEDLNVLLSAASGGDRSAMDRLFARVYPELLALAHQVRRGRAGETLDTTALAHEAWLKLASGRPVEYQGQAHFRAVAARAMRQILVDSARRRVSQKRGGRDQPVTLEDDVLPAPLRPDRILALDAALERLATVDERRASVVEHRFFGGLTADEIATVLGVSVATVERDWRAARAWLAVELGETP
jgi:RNA polymerase sigma factor (TIGR02999 family)